MDFVITEAIGPTRISPDPRPATTKPVYRIRNWSQHKDALVRRGSLTLWVDRAALGAWLYQEPTQWSAQFRFSDSDPNLPLCESSYLGWNTFSDL